VLLHGSGGLGASIYARGRWLQAAGYEALVVDSMTSRGAKSV
jgi:dienelactone hydrolase